MNERTIFLAALEKDHLAERLRLTSMHLDCLIEGIDFYSQTRLEIEAAAAKLPGADWRQGLVAAVIERERRS